jgi:hypothetical protein
MDRSERLARELAKLREVNAMAEAERRSLEGRLSSLEAKLSARIAALEEEVEALLPPSSPSSAAELYERRCRELGVALDDARAQRQRLEVLLQTNGAPPSEIEQARDAALVRGALERESELGERLAEAESRARRLRTSD